MDAANFLFNWGVPSERTARNKILGLISEQRPIISAMVFPMTLASATLSLGRLPGFFQNVAIFIITYLATSCMHVVNDIIDIERDKKKWPLRPMATGLLSRSESISYATIMAAISLILAYLYFNWQFPAVIGLVLLLGSIYSAFTRDRIGYLTLIFIPAFIPIGGWVAFSPDTIFSTLPWVLYLFFIIHQVGHMVATEIHFPEAKPFLFRPAPERESLLYGFSVISMLVVGIMIYFIAEIHWVYLIVLGALTVFALISFGAFMKDPRSEESAKKASGAMVNYNIFYWLALIFAAVI